MSDRERFRPFTGDASKHILLKEAPLPLVLCQIRWPELNHLQLEMRPLALAFGAQLEDYPIFQESQEVSYTITPEGVQQVGGGAVFEWRSLDGAWTVSLGKRFMSFYCTKYTNYAVFEERLADVLGKLVEHIRVPVIERVGVRYVNQISNPDLVDDLGEYVSPDVLGYSSLKPVSSGVRLVSNANQALYSVEDVMLQVRSGVVPAGETVDPAVAAIGSESWVLDLDAFTARIVPFDVASALTMAGKLSDAAYDFFKLVVTDGFIREFGGEV